VIGELEGYKIAMADFNETSFLAEEAQINAVKNCKDSRFMTGIRTGYPQNARELFTEGT
jgi:hypothetical protein